MRDRGPHVGSAGFDCQLARRLFIGFVPAQLFAVSGYSAVILRITFPGEQFCTDTSGESGPASNSEGSTHHWLKGSVPVREPLSLKQLEMPELKSVESPLLTDRDKSGRGKSGHAPSVIPSTERGPPSGHKSANPSVVPRSAEDQGPSLATTQTSHGSAAAELASAHAAEGRRGAQGDRRKILGEIPRPAPPPSPFPSLPAGPWKHIALAVAHLRLRRWQRAVRDGLVARRSAHRQEDREGPSPIRRCRDSDTFMLSGAEDSSPRNGSMARRGHATHATTAILSSHGSFRARKVSAGSSGGAFGRPARSSGGRPQGQRHQLLRQDVREPDRRSQENPLRVFAWLLCETRDDRGDLVRYHYKGEDDANVPARRGGAEPAHRAGRRPAVLEADRIWQSGAVLFGIRHRLAVPFQSSSTTASTRRGNAGGDRRLALADGRLFRPTARVSRCAPAVWPPDTGVSCVRRALGPGPSSVLTGRPRSAMTRTRSAAGSTRSRHRQ